VPSQVPRSAPIIGHTRPRSTAELYLEIVKPALTYGATHCRLQIMSMRRYLRLSLGVDIDPLSETIPQSIGSTARVHR
jgi:hypothetical protein